VWGEKSYRITFDPTVPFLGTEPKEMKVKTQISTPMFTATLFTIVKNRNTTNIPQ
jgi:hypothetical protein